MSHIPPDRLEAIGLGTSAASVPSILATAWSKTSFAITLYRLMRERWQRAGLWFLAVSMNFLLTLLAALSFLRCVPPEKVWKPYVEGSCMSMETYLVIAIFASSYSAVVDMTLAVAPWPVVWKTSLVTKEKVGLALAMSMGVV